MRAKLPAWHKLRKSIFKCKFAQLTWWVNPRVKLCLTCGLMTFARCYWFTWFLVPLPAINSTLSSADIHSALGIYEGNHLCTFMRAPFCHLWCSSWHALLHILGPGLDFTWGRQCAAQELFILPFKLLDNYHSYLGKLGKVKCGNLYFTFARCPRVMVSYQPHTHKKRWWRW